MLGLVGEGQKPWDLRDKFRAAAVDLNPMFIHRDDSPYPFEQCSTGYALASGALKVKGPAHLLKLYEAHHPLLRAKPQDILTLLRPAGVADARDKFIRLPGIPPIHSEVRGAKYFAATCESFERFAFKKETHFTDEHLAAQKSFHRKFMAESAAADGKKASGGGATPESLDVRPWRLDALHKDLGRGVASIQAPKLFPDYSFELSIMYCMRAHTIHKTYDEFVELHDLLAVEVLLVPGFPAISVPGRMLDPKGLGDALAGYLTRFHHSLAERGVFSPRLMDFCMVDVHRVHIEEEMRVTKLLGDNLLKGSYWQVVDEQWLVRWRRFVSGRGARRYLPPCQITNDSLLHWEKAQKAGTQPLKRSTPHADMDYDQKLAQKREWREAFKLMDVDLDGTITTAALGNVLRALGRSLTQAELADLVNQVDADGNGTVSFAEFESMMGKLKGGVGQDWDEVQDCFRLYDKEGSGTVNFAELKHELMQTGERLGGDEFGALGLDAFVDKDGLFNYEDHVKLLKHRETGRREQAGRKAVDSGGAWKQVPNTHLNLVTDYRVVNYNVWVYWVRVHGGGPAITRKGREIYSEPAKSRLQGTLLLQCWARQAVAAVALDKAFLKDFTQTAKGCRQTLCQHLVKKVISDGSEQVKQYLRRDNDKRLNKHAKFAAGVWKKKKGISSMDKSLARLKSEQTIFSASSGKIEEAAEGQPLVVEEHAPVILIGSAEEYETVLTEERGLQFMKVAKLRKHSACEMAYIANVPEGFDARVGGRHNDGIFHNSVLLEVNDFPVNSLEFGQTMERITSTRWPLKLRWRRPINLTECFSLIEIATNILGDPKPREETEWRKGGLQGETTENQEEQNRLMYEEYCDTWKGSSIVKMQVLKRRLVRGVTVRVHGSPTMGGGSYLTRIYLTETHFFWEEPSRSNPELDRNQVASGVTLYELKFVTSGKGSDNFKKVGPKIPAGMCFSIHFEWEGGSGCLDCEVSDALPPTGNEEAVRNRIRGEFKKDPGEVRADVLVWGIRNIIDEVQSTQLYYDEDGLPKKRRLPKKKLKILGGE